MKTSELVKDFLLNQGYRIENDCEDGIIFKARGLTFIYHNNDEDSDYFQVSLPSVYDITEDNREIALEIANKNNMGMKVVKTCILDDSVWIYFEIFLDDTPVIDDIMPRALKTLLAARDNFYELMS